MNPALLIHGPTASGKTELAVRLAKALDGEVVNADSMQVYKDLRVLTARPVISETVDIPHHLFGTVDGAIRYSTGQWLEEAGPVIRDIQRRGKTPIVTGGTGLYFLSLIQGLSDIPPIPEEVRSEVKADLRASGPQALHAQLATIDPVSAADIESGDRQRIARALEVWHATGRPLSAYHHAKQPPLLEDREWMGIALTPPRARLYARIDRRFGSMLMEGAMDEVRTLAGRRLPDDLPIMKAHGMPWLMAYLRGEIPAEEAADHAKRDTRRYAKRQFTWVANQFPFWPRIPSMDVDRRQRVILALYRDIDG